MQKPKLKMVAAAILAGMGFSLAAQAAAPTTPQGVITAKEFLNIGGTAIPDLTNNAKFPNSPDIVAYPPVFEWPTGEGGAQPPGNVKDNYGVQIQGYFYPAESGNYNFWLAADDNARFFISTDEDPAKKALVAQEPEWNGVRNWTTTDRRGVADAATGRRINVSAPIALVAGKAYYVEGLMKEGGGGDNLAVGFTVGDYSIDAPPAGPIPGEQLSSFDKASGIASVATQPASQTVGEGGTVTFSVVANGTPGYTYQWTRNNVDIDGATGQSTSINPVAFSDNNASFRVKIVNALGEVTSNPAVLTVTRDTVAPTIVSANAIDPNTVDVRFSEPVSEATAGLAANYSIAGLAITSVTVVSSTTVRLATALQTSAQNYTVTVNGVKDVAAAPNTIAANSTSQFIALAFVRGYLKMESWLNIGGTPVANLEADARYQAGVPDSVAYVNRADSRLVYPTDALDSYGVRMSGFIVPPTTGEYRFFINSDDASELRLSTDATKENLVKIAEETGCCNAFGEPGVARTSEPQSLVAGQRYAIEYIYKEGGGGDYGRLAIREEADTTPAGSLPTIPGSFLATYADPRAEITITTQPANVSAAASSRAVFTVAYTATSALGNTASVQWQKAPAGSSTFANIAGQTGNSLVIPFASPGDNGAQYRAVLSIGDLKSVTSNAGTLTVLPETIAPIVVGSSGSLTMITIVFNEPMNAATLIAGNFAINGGGSITGAAAATTGSGAGLVVLTATGLTAGREYEVTVNNAADLSGNKVAANTKTSFTAYTVAEGFESATIAGVTTVGSAVIQSTGGTGNSGAILLTPSINSQQGTIYFNDVLNGAEMTSMTAIFRLRIGDGSGNPADGFAFSVGSDLGAGSFGEEGVGTGLTVSLDTYDNGGGEAPAIDVKWGGLVIASAKVAKAILVNGQYVTVAIKLTSDGKVTVQHNGIVYHDKVQIDGYAPITGPSIGLGARTGGERASHRVDDLNIALNADVPLPQGPQVRFASTTASPNLKGVTVRFNAPVEATSAALAANYTLNGGATVSAVKVINPSTVFLTTSQQTEGQVYQVTVGTGVKDGAGRSILPASATQNFRAMINVPGFVSWQAYRDIGGGNVNDLLGSPKFPNFPDDVRLNTVFEGPTGYADNYGSKLSGFVEPTATGNYRFYISTDDNGRLFVSTDDSPANTVLVAEEPQWSGVRDWNGTDRRTAVDDGAGGTRQPNVSNPIALVAGKRYYIELLEKEGGGGDNSAATFALDGEVPANATIALDSAVMDTAVAGQVLSTPAAAVGGGGERGFTARIHQVDQVGTTSPANTWTRAEQQLAGLLGPNVANMTAAVDGKFNVNGVVNWNQDLGGSAGGFPTDDPIPGIPGTGATAARNTDAIAGEISAWIEFPAAGVYILGVNSDDGFRVTSGAAPANNGALVVTGGAAAGTYSAISGGLGENSNGTFGRITAPIAGKLVMVDSSADAIPTEGCSPLSNAPIVRGNIAVFVRGTCSFDIKVSNALEAGATAVVIINNRDLANAEGIFPIVAVGGLRDIPVVMVSQPDGAKIQTALGTETVNVTLTPDSTEALGQVNYGRGAIDTTFAVKVNAPGLYPIRTLWWEGGGGANIEIFSVDLATGAKMLVNDASNANALKAFRTLGPVGPQGPRLTITRNGNQVTVTWTPVEGRLQWSNVVTGGWANAGDNDGSYTEAIGAGAKFFRVIKP